MGQAREQARDRQEQHLLTFAVANVPGLYACLQEQALRIDQNMTPPALNLFAPVIAFDTADLGGLDQLTIKYPRARLGVTPDLVP